MSIAGIIAWRVHLHHRRLKSFVSYYAAHLEKFTYNIPSRPRAQRILEYLCKVQWPIDWYVVREERQI